MKTKLVIIGASYLQVPLIRKARQMQIETHVFAWEKDAVGKEYSDYFYPISIVEKDAILQRAEAIRPDGVVSIASDLAAVTVNYLAVKLGLTGNTLDVTARTTNKYLMRQRLSDSGLPCPGFMRVSRGADALRCGFLPPVIVKPTDRSGSRGVTKVSAVADIRPAVERAIGESLQGQALIEEFVEGREISVEAITWKGAHHFLAITDKVTTGPPYFVETEQHEPSTLSTNVQDDAWNVVHRALTCLGVEFGASHSELLVTPDHKIFIVEIGARMGGDCIGSHLVEMSTGYDFIRGVIEISLGHFNPVQRTRDQFAGIYYLTAPAGRVQRIVDRTSDYPQIVEKAVLVNTGDLVGEVHESGERLGYYIYVGPVKFVPAVAPLAVVTDNSA